MNTRHALPRPNLTTLTLPIAEVRDGDTILALEPPNSVRLRRQRTNADGLPGWRITRTMGRRRILERTVYCSFEEAVRETEKRVVPHAERALAQHPLHELAALTDDDIEHFARAMDRTWPLPSWANDLYGPNGEGRGDVVRLVARTGLRWSEAVETAPAELRERYCGVSPALRQVIDRLDAVRARGRERDEHPKADSWVAAVCSRTGAPVSRMRVRRAFVASGEASGVAVQPNGLRLRYLMAHRPPKRAQAD